MSGPSQYFTCWFINIQLAGATERERWNENDSSSRSVLERRPKKMLIPMRGGHFQQAVIALCTCTTNVLSAFVVWLLLEITGDDAGPVDISFSDFSDLLFLKMAGRDAFHGQPLSRPGENAPSPLINASAR
jgi:hypothetical protein